MDASHSDVPTPNGILYAGEIPEDFLKQNSLESTVKRLDANVQKILAKEKVKKAKGRRAIVKYKGDGILQYREMEYKMAKNTSYANLSAKVYEHCQQVGSNVPCAVVFEGITGRRYETDPIDYWKKLYQDIRSANRWANHNKLPILFRCSKDSIERLI